MIKLTVGMLRFFRSIILANTFGQILVQLILGWDDLFLVDVRLWPCTKHTKMSFCQAPTATGSSHPHWCRTQCGPKPSTWRSASYWTTARTTRWPPPQVAFTVVVGASTTHSLCHCVTQSKFLSYLNRSKEECDLFSTDNFVAFYMLCL